MYNQNFAWGRGGDKGAWFPEKNTGGKLVCKSLGRKLNGPGRAGCSVRTCSKMAAENPTPLASHCDQIYCGLLRVWHIKFKP